MTTSTTDRGSFSQLLFRTLAFGLLVLLVSCGGIRMSREYIAAKDAVNRKDWPEAKQLLEKEVARNRNNGEAWYMLGWTRQHLGDIKGMNEAYSIAERNAANDDFKVAISRARFTAWAELFNTSVEIYNRFAENGDSSKLEKGVETMKTAIELKPELPENYSVLGLLYDAKRDTVASLNAYEKYASMQQSAIQLARSNALYLGMNRSVALDKIGQAANSQSMLSGADSVAIDVIKNRDTVYLYSLQKDKSTYIVEGWRVNPSSSWTDLEEKRYAPMNIRPFAQLASTYYNRRDMEKALKYIDVISTLKPSDEQAQNLRVQVYADQGKSAEALMALSDLVKQDPKNKSYLCNYALALLKMERYDDAVSNYEKALAIDPDYDVALINCAAALKNRAAQFQKEERERREKDSKYKENTDRYFPLLNKSAEYFDRYRRLSTHRDDLSSMEHLVNIYETMRKTNELKAVVAELEGLEFSNTNNPRYWEILGGVYSRLRQSDRADRAFKKADEAKARLK